MDSLTLSGKAKKGKRLAKVRKSRRQTRHLSRNLMQKGLSWIRRREVKQGVRMVKDSEVRTREGHT